MKSQIYEIVLRRFNYSESTEAVVRRSQGDAPTSTHKYQLTAASSTRLEALIKGGRLSPAIRQPHITPDILAVVYKPASAWQIREVLTHVRQVLAQARRDRNTPKGSWLDDKFNEVDKFLRYSRSESMKLD